MKYLGLDGLGRFTEMSRNIFSLKSHTHLVSQISDYKVDDTLSKESSHPIQNRTVTKAIDMVVADQKLLIPGIIYPYAGSADTVPDGFLLCDGREIERVKYINLYNVIKDTYGDTGSLLTFKLPDLCGRVPIGASSDYALASNGGYKDVTLTADQIPSHSHGMQNHTHSMSNHTHGLNNHTHTAPAHTHPLAGSGAAAVSNGAHTHKSVNAGTYVVTATANTQSADVYNGSLAGRGYKVPRFPDTTGLASSQTTTSSAGAHTHTLTGNTAGSNQLTTGGNSGNTTGPSTANTGAPSNNTTTATGGSKSHSNMQPYIAINYIISTGLEYEPPTVTPPDGEVEEVVPIG